MLLQPHLHSWLNTWLQWIEQRQLQVKMRNILGVPYIRVFTVFIFSSNKWSMAKVENYNFCRHFVCQEKYISMKGSFLWGISGFEHTIFLSQICFNLLNFFKEKVTGICLGHTSVVPTLVKVMWCLHYVIWRHFHKEEFQSFAISKMKNVRKCKYRFMFPEINSAGQGLTLKLA